MRMALPLEPSCDSSRQKQNKEEPMPIEIKVAPSGITISQGRTFMVTNSGGEINPQTDEGVFAIDTRFISYYHLFINRVPWVLVNSSQLSFYASRTYLTNPKISTEEGNIEANTIGLTVERTIEGGIHEDFYVVNYTGKKISITLELALRSDFADLFEVKSKRLVNRGRMLTAWDTKERRLRTSYDNKDFHRAVTYAIPSPGVPVGYANGRIFFELELEPGQEWQTCGELILEHGQQVMEPFYGHRTSEQLVEPLSELDKLQARWLDSSPKLLTPNEHVYRAYRQAIEDMGALRIYDLDVSEEEWVPAAGVPWFVTLFGRDSLIVSLQNMAVSTAFARGALKWLAASQATERDDYRDAQPGKILHEMRFGELAHFNKIPHTPYYGTADATILYLVVLSETYRWTGDINLLKQYREVADGCLKWIDQYGELQGYVYDAKVRMAEMFRALGDEARAQTLLQEAEALKRRFHEIYWMEDEGCYAYGQDGQKRLITSVTSNAGQCLRSGIADQDKAERTAKRLLQEDMWSGWGIRTLSSKNPAYNPYSYHLGSVWPHDNGIIAAGFKRYGLANEANQVTRGMFDAARRFEAYRLPEIFAGLRRKGKAYDFPALYPPGANIPQGWASGSVFQMVQTILGLRADAPHKRLYVNPTLPAWFSEVVLRNLRVGPCTFALHFWREGERSRWEVVDMTVDSAVAQGDVIQVRDELAVASSRSS